MSGSNEFDLPLVFAGYGITAKDKGYDDYDGLDVHGKAVILLRHEPQRDNPHSPFDGVKTSDYATFRHKVSNAFEHGAGAVIFTTDEFDIRSNVAVTRKQWQEAVDRLVKEYAEFKGAEKPSPEEIERQRVRIDELTRQISLWSEKLRAEYDPMLPFNAAESDRRGRSFPVLYCQRSFLDPLVTAALGVDLATLEHRIDDGLKPQSRAMEGWSVRGRADVRRTEATVKNVLAILPGEGPLAEEYVVLGAHYDHLGMGGPGSLEPNSHAVHNGADDNASGVAVLLEVARELAARPKKPRRSVVFIAFTGEEEGLLGSAYYVQNPVFPLEKTVAMVNMDMVGRLRDDKLIVLGAATSGRFEGLLEGLNARHHFQLTRTSDGLGPSDQASFYARKIPVMHFFTGTHADYHRPTDDFDKLNIAGMRRVAAMVADTVETLAQEQARPEYVAVAPPPARGKGTRPYFGSMPDFGGNGEGYHLGGVTPGGPAQRAGLAGGDSIVQFGDSKIGNLEDFDNALRKYHGGDRVRVTVLRDGREQTFEVTLDPPR
jgi:hypothetical protein